MIRDHESWPEGQRAEGAKVLFARVREPEVDPAILARARERLEARRARRWLPLGLAPAAMIVVLAAGGTTFAALGGPAWVRSLLVPRETVAVPERTAPPPRGGASSAPVRAGGVAPSAPVDHREESGALEPVERRAEPVPLLPEVRASRRREASIRVVEREVRVSSAAPARRAIVQGGEPIIEPAARELERAREGGDHEGTRD